MLGLEGIWIKMHPSPLPRTQHVAQRPLTGQEAADAKQAALDFFTAMHDEDWTNVAKFWPKNMPDGKQMNDLLTDNVKKMIGGLEIISIGTPYKESGSGWVMIPYEVNFKGGGSQTNNLRMQKVLMANGSGAADFKASPEEMTPVPSMGWAARKRFGRRLPRRWDGESR